MENILNIAVRVKDYGYSQYTHFARVTIPDSHLKETYKEFKRKFPEPLYKLELTKWQTVGTTIKTDDWA